MTEENNKINETNVSEPFAKLNELPKENISEKDKIEAQKIFIDLFTRVLQGEPITIAEYNIMSNIAPKDSVYNKAMYEILGQLSKNGQKAILQSVQNVATRKQATASNQQPSSQKKSETNENTSPDTPDKPAPSRGQSGKNNIKPILNKLDALSRVKAPKNSHRKEMANQISLLNDELAQKNYLFSAKEKQIFTVAYKKYPTEIDTAFQGAENKNEAFVTLYNEMSGKDEPIPTSTEQRTPATPNRTQEEAQEFANALGSLLHAVAKQAQEREEMAMPNTPQQAPNAWIDELAPSDKIIINGLLRSNLYKELNDEQRNEITNIAETVASNRNNNPDEPKNFSEQFANQILASDNFTEKQKNIIFNIARKAEQVELIQEMNDILSKGHENWNDNDIARLQALSKTNITIGGLSTNDISAKLTEHQTWLDAQSPEQEAASPSQEGDANDAKPAVINGDNEGIQDDAINGGDEEHPGVVIINEDEEDEPEPVTVTDEEITEYITELKDSTTEEEYLNSIDPKIKERNIEASMALEESEPEYETYIDDNGEEQFTLDENGEKKLVSPYISALRNRALALSDPDDMLVAYNYYTTKYKGEDKEQKIADLKEVINYNLRQYNPKDINPQNAFVLLTLAEKIYDYSNENCNGDLTYKWITEDIARAQKAYDQEKFGPRLEGETREQQAERIEENYTESLEALEKLDSEETLKLLDDYEFTKDNGKPLRKIKLPFLPNQQKEVQEGILATARMMVATDLAKTGLPQDIKDNEGLVIKSADDQLMEKMQDAVNQILQKPDGSKTFTLSEIGGRLGGAMVAKPETFVKRIKQKFNGLPIVKKIKGKFDKLDKKLSDSKVFGKAYKVGKKIAKITMKVAPSVLKNSALFAAASLVPGGVPALITVRTVKQWKNIKKSLNDPAVKKSTKAGLLIGAVATTAVSAIGVGGFDVFAHNIMGAVTRTGISTAGAAMPNIIERTSLALKGRKLKKDLAKATKANNAAEIARLTAEQKKLDLKKKNVKEDLLKVGLAAALGFGFTQSGLAHTVMHEVSDAFHNDDTPPDDKTGDHKTEGKGSEGKESDGKTEGKESDGKGSEGKESDGKTEGKESDGKGSEGKDNDVSPEEKAAAEAKAHNLAAAEEKGSGHMGKSDMESMQTDMDREAAKIGLTGEQATATMKALAEGYGTESYEAMHASLADPYAFAEQMGITADVMASAEAAGIDTSTNFSGAVLNHLATHPELADNDGFKAYVAEHFDEQDRFHYSEQAVHTPHHTPHHASPNTTYAAQNSAGDTSAHHETKITYTPVDHLPGQQQPAPQPTHTETQTTHVQQQATVIHSVPTNNLHYDPLLSQNLNYEKYSGAYIDPNRIIDGKPAVVYMPVDELHDKPIIRSMDDAMKMADYPGGDTLGIYNSPTGVDLNNPENNYGYGYGYGHHGRICIGNGAIVHTTVASNDFGKQLGQYAAARATDIALRQGEHALTHVIENTLGRGRL